MAERFKSPTQPLCRFCGRPIRKWTTYYQFGPDHRSAGDEARRGKPLSIAEAQREINSGRIVHVKWKTPTQLEHSEFVPTGEPRWICEASVWDGESYADGFFDTGSCAQSYAYMVVEACGLVSKNYNAALAKRAEKGNT